MTGYASAQHGASATGAETDPRASQARRLGLEIRSVNSRFLDLSFRLPDELRAQEPALRSLLTARLKRGKVEVRAALESEDNNALQDPPARLLQRLNSMQDSVRAWLPSAAPLTVADALRICTIACRVERGLALPGGLAAYCGQPGERTARPLAGAHDGATAANTKSPFAAPVGDRSAPDIKPNPLQSHV